MASQRLMRAPLRLAAQRVSPVTFRAAAIAPFSTKPTAATTQKQSAARINWFAPPPAPGKNMTPVKAAMPQLVPFYFVNEVFVAFTLIPLLTWVFTKYILPNKLRLFAARLFTSKL